MKRLAFAPLLAAAAVTAHAQGYLDHARVSSVDPQYESVRVPRQECGSRWAGEPYRGGAREYGGAVLGGIAGALVGNQVGRGHGREAATALGAVVGAFAGDRLANRDRWAQPRPVSREVTTCRQVEEVQTRLAGYRVTYEYRGQQFTTLMQEDPGPFVNVHVSVDPVGR